MKTRRPLRTVKDAKLGELLSKVTPGSRKYLDSAMCSSGNHTRTLFGMVHEGQGSHIVAARDITMGAARKMVPGSLHGFGMVEMSSEAALDVFSGAEDNNIDSSPGVEVGGKNGAKRNSLSSAFTP